MRLNSFAYLSAKRTGWRQLCALLLLTLFCAVPASAQNQIAAVRSDPPVLEISPGETATLTVVIDDAQDLYGIDVRASFDPQLLEVVDADPAMDGVQMMAGELPQPDFVARNVADNDAGTLRYAVTQVNPTEPANGSGIVYSVQLRAKASAGESAFTIGLVEMADRTGQLLEVQPQSGVIRITPAEQATAIAPTDTPEPATPVAESATAMPAETPVPVATTPKPVSPIVPIAALALLVLIGVIVFIVVRR